MPDRWDPRGDEQSGSGYTPTGMEVVGLGESGPSCRKVGINYDSSTEEGREGGSSGILAEVVGRPSRTSSG